MVSRLQFLVMFMSPDLLSLSITATIRRVKQRFHIQNRSNNIIIIIIIIGLALTIPSHLHVTSQPCP